MNLIFIHILFLITLKSKLIKIIIENISPTMLSNILLSLEQYNTK